MSRVRVQPSDALNATEGRGTYHSCAALTLPFAATTFAVPFATSIAKSFVWPRSGACVYSVRPSGDRCSDSAGRSHDGATSRVRPLPKSIAMIAKRSASKPGRFIAR